MGYNVIWIDDEWDTRGKPFILLCEKKHNIHITPFKTRKEGMDLLLKDERPWDAVILDAKAYNESENETANLKGLSEAIKQIEGLRMKKSIPYFVLTRQPDLLDSDTFKELIGDFYKKGEAEKEGEIIKVKGQEQLIEDLKAKVDGYSRTQVEAFYPEALKVLKSYDKWCGEKVHDILESMHFPEKIIDPLLYYNPLRQTLEYIFRTANKASIIPDEFIGREKDDVNLSQCVHFLSGRNADWIGIRYGGPKDTIVPPHIRDMMFQILNLGNINSHSRTFNNVELKKLGKYFDENVCNSLQLIYSLALQICEIAIYMFNYIATHRNISENRKLCKTFGIVEQVEGNESICMIKSKRPGRESCICMSATFAKDKGLIGKKVVVMEEKPNLKQEIKESFPFFAVKTQPLEKENGSK